MSRTTRVTIAWLALGLCPAALESQRSVSTAIVAPDSRTGAVAVELETLLSSTAATHGQFARQDMRPFGRGWSQDAHLFWGGAQQGAQLRLTFQSGASGRFQAYLRFTRAPDFALMRVSLDGAPSIAINGYAPTVSSDRVLLGTVDIAPGLRELLVEVAMKDPRSSGLNVGLDRLELEPQTSPPRAGAGGGPQSVVGPVIAGAQLAFAAYTPNGKQATLGGTERNVYRPNLTVSLAWKTQGTAPHRWQVTSQPPGSVASLTPNALLAEGSAAPGSFPIPLDSFQPLAPGGVPQRDVARSFYIRLIPVVNGALAGAASNVVVAHYIPGVNPSAKTIADAIAKTADAQKKLAEMKEQARIYDVSIVNFKPMVFADPSQWGCIVIVTPSPSYPQYSKGEKVCGDVYRGQGNSINSVWDVIGSWVKAYDIMAGFYSSAKSWISSQIAQLAPCEAMGSQLAGTCEEFVNDVAAAGISVGLTAAGVPPYLPNVSDLSGMAEGKVVQAAVDFTCHEFESQGGQCTPAMRTGLSVLYQQGIDQIQKGIATAAKEPGCGDVKEAHDHGREPLPCFTKVGMDVKPAPGAVTEPATITVRVRRVKADPPFILPACTVKADVSLTNYYAGGAPHAVNLKAQTLQGYPFVAPDVAIAPMAVGETRDITLVFEKLKPFKLSGNYGNVWLDDWMYLYKGGKGTASAFTQTVMPVAGTKNYQGVSEKLECGSAPGLPVQIPQ